MTTYTHRVCVFKLSGLQWQNPSFRNQTQTQTGVGSVKRLYIYLYIVYIFQHTVFLLLKDNGAMLVSWFL